MTKGQINWGLLTVFVIGLAGWVHSVLCLIKYGFETMVTLQIGSALWLQWFIMGSVGAFASIIWLVKYGSSLDFAHYGEDDGIRSATGHVMCWACFTRRAVFEEQGLSVCAQCRAGIKSGDIKIHDMQPVAPHDCLQFLDKKNGICTECGRDVKT